MAKLQPNDVGDRLLGDNYLPRISASMEELPPCFTTKSFDLHIARTIVGLNEKRSTGYDAAQIYATRFNLVQRQLGLPHPAAYAGLVVHIVDNWSHYEHTETNKASRIRPRKWKDGRIASMDPIGRAPRRRPGARYLVEADIAACYPSIYTHSLSWALVGHQQAKADRNKKGQYFNEIDYYTRQLQRNETSGLLIGPATSSIAAEIILGKIDADLRSKGFRFSRFIDDYRFYAKTAAEGERFLRSLNEALATMNLQVNPRKTRFVQLPSANTPTWIRDLLSKRPRRKRVTTRDALALLDYAIELTEEFPDASALKYALTTIENVIPSSSSPKFDFDTLSKTLLGLAFHRPVAIPFLVRVLLDHPSLVTNRLGRDVSRIIREHALHKRSDAVTWLLFLLHELGQQPKDAAVDAVLKSRDCMSLVLLGRIGGLYAQTQIDDFVADLIKNKIAQYELDQYWPLLYDLYLQGRIANPYAGSKVFETMKQSGVELIDLQVGKIAKPGVPRRRDPYSILV